MLTWRAGSRQPCRMRSLWLAQREGLILRPAYKSVLRRILHLYWRFSRGLTLGVRAIVLDSANRVFLIRHSYVAGWHLPGGGVEPGETARDALIRELKEEGNIEV